MRQLLRRTNQRPSRVCCSSSSSASSRGTSTGGPFVIRGWRPPTRRGTHGGVQLVDGALVEQVPQQVRAALAQQVLVARARPARRLSAARSTRCPPSTSTWSSPSTRARVVERGGGPAGGHQHPARLGVAEPLGHPAGAADDDGRPVGRPVALDPGGPGPDDDRVGELAQQVEDPLVDVVVDRPARARLPRGGTVQRRRPCWRAARASTGRRTTSGGRRRSRPSAGPSGPVRIRMRLSLSRALSDAAPARACRLE